VSKKIIVFTSEHDDDELFCSAAGEIWKGFGTEYKRFVVGLNKAGKADMYCWEELPDSWDILVVWEPPVAEQNFKEQYYAEQLNTIKNECSRHVSQCGIVRVLYHVSTKKKYRLKQTMFISGLLSDDTAVLEHTYSHIKNDRMYQKVAQLLGAGWDMESEERYQKKMTSFVLAWPERTFPYCSMLTLLAGASIKALSKGFSERDLPKSWNRAFEGATVQVVKEGLQKETMGCGQEQLSYIFQLLDSVEMGAQLTSELLDKAKQSLMQLQAIAGTQS